MPERLQINIRIDDETERRLRALARKLSIPRASVVRLAIARLAELEKIEEPSDAD